MHKLSTIYRSSIAAILSVWMMIIIISGVVFMHKEVTSTGEIITHIHPYDFTKKQKPHHHKSDAEIQYLNVVFLGAYLQSDFTVLEIPLSPLVFFIDFKEITISSTIASVTEYHLRGPPLA